ncbi:MAG: SLBB domain-containing protein, partial [Candidatus Eisenbacteria bacterium]|nr:SLBB domain-containing protein [Candidatus Eisenbacteria bacterium]
AFRVPVTGLVVNPGIQSLRGYDRLSIALAAAGGPLPGGTLRRVVLEQPDGSKREVDLVRFAIEGDVDQNPPLRPGCRVHVPPAQDFVRVAGAVRGLPGPTQAVVVPNVGSRIVEPPNIMLEWLDGDTAGFLLARAGGLSEDASGEVFLVRGGERRALSREEAQSLPLEAGDQLEAAVRNRWVYVIGAVRYPGPYAHLPTRTASDYVRMAGGPTELGRGDGWKLRPAEGAKAQDVGSEAYLAPGATVIVPERWTYRVSTLLAPISGITALVISVVALTK